MINYIIVQYTLLCNNISVSKPHSIGSCIEKRFCQVQFG